MSQIARSAALSRPAVPKHAPLFWLTWATAAAVAAKILAFAVAGNF